MQDGILKRKENTVYFENKEGRRILPINKINSIFAYGNLSFSSGVVSYLSKEGIPIHLAFMRVQCTLGKPWSVETL